MKHKRIFMALLAAAMLTASAFAADFAKRNTYLIGMFTDVGTSDWFEPSVGAAYELGFVQGVGNGAFSPMGTMTAVEAITIAARVNDAYYAKNTAFANGSVHWYDEYVTYALENGIIQDGDFDDYDRNIKRWEMAAVFANALPKRFLP